MENTGNVLSRFVMLIRFAVNLRVAINYLKRDMKRTPVFHDNCSPLSFICLQLLVQFYAHVTIFIIFGRNYS